MPLLDTNIFLLGDNSALTQSRHALVATSDRTFQLRLVLTWDPVIPSAGFRDLDLFVEFQPNSRFLCSVGFYNPVCEGVAGNFDSQNSQTVNVETVDFKAIGGFEYIVYVG